MLVCNIHQLKQHTFIQLLTLKCHQASLPDTQCPTTYQPDSLLTYIS